MGSALVANRIYSETLHELERNAGPGTMLQRLHNFVYDRLAADGFCFTMAAARFSHNGRRVTFAAAGHPPAMIVSDGVLRLLDSQNGILGCLADTMLSDSADEIDLAIGDRLVLYTDGLVEVFNQSHEMLAVKGLAKLVRESATQPLHGMKQTILDRVTTWRRGPIVDDISLMIIELR
jgi:serine phosphatase RsbU (regulator of sigma subunit)